MTTPIEKVLVANRGEIALRVMKTCREMGIATVAVFSDADADAPHVFYADEAVRLGPAPSAESYLRIEGIIEACRTTGAQAVHPGYGFLSENAAFAAACEEAGIIFIGPGAEAIEKMGSKKAAKAIAQEAGVPVVPGYNGEDQSAETLIAEAKRIGFPCLLKASAGGGGKGMRVVHQEKELQDALAAAKREAANSFGDDTMLIEKYITNPRHIEIQILGDAHGDVVHLFERECSIQRRHQKIIEESPSVALDDELRATMGDAAVRLAKAIGYKNAGTVEFIVGQDGGFYFLEVNTRLQVEHPVTEEVTGVDLVREQIRVAEGQPLRFAQHDLTQNGAALECRIYAEDPANEFLPASGVLADWNFEEIPGLRVDSGVESGQEVSIHYDPMLAKVITRGADREEARRRMVRALEGLSAPGLKTNREFLLELLRHPAYISGEIDTHFIARHYEEGWSRQVDADEVRRAAVVAALVGVHQRSAEREILPTLGLGFRNNFVQPQWVVFRDADEQHHRVEYRSLSGGRFELFGEEGEREVVRFASCGEHSWFLQEASGYRTTWRVVSAGGRIHLLSRGFSLSLEEAPRYPVPGEELPAGGCTAPMTGTIFQVAVEVGQQVEQGQLLVIMEAMKMEHRVTAPQAGVVRELFAVEGAQADEGALLAVIEEEE